MATPSRTERPAPAPSPRRRRIRWRAAGVLVLLGLLVGRGFGWLGGGGAPDPTGPASTEQPPPAAVPVPPDVVVAVAPSAVPEPGAAVLVQAAAGAPVAPSPVAPVLPPQPLGEAAPTTPAPQPPAAAAPVPEPVVGLDPDRFGSLLSVLDAQVTARQFGGARQVAARLLALSLDPAQRAVVAARGEALERSLSTTVAEVVAALSAGQVIAAEATLATLLAEDPAPVLPLLWPQLRLPGTGADLDHVPPQDGAPWPLPQPLPKQRAVRMVRDGVPVVGRVVDSRAERITLRLEAGGVVLFPAVPVVDCEPVDATAAEAVEMAFAALHGRRPRLARLWLSCAILRGGETAAAERLQRLRELLH